MKIELDFDNKTITVKGTVGADDLLKKIKNLGLSLKDWSFKNEEEGRIDDPFFPQQPFDPYHPYPSMPWLTICDTKTIMFN